MSKISLLEFKNRAMLVHGRFYCYDNVSFDKIADKIEIICPKHGLFLQSASGHLRGHKCSKCSNDLVQQNKSKKIQRVLASKSKKYPS